MKKRIICQITSVLLATILISATGFPQNDPVSDEPAKKTAIGIRIGGMSSDLWFPGKTKEPPDQLVPLKSQTLGVFLSKNQSSNYLFYADIMYERKGCGMFPVEKLSIDKYVISSPFHPQALQYISVSTYLLYKTRGQTVFCIGPGIYNAFLFRHYMVFTEDDGYSTYKGASSFGFHGYDIGLGLKAGIRHPIRDNLFADLNITSSSGFIPIFYKHWRSISDHLPGHQKDRDFYALNKTLAGTLSLSYRF